ncbi:UNVERIFIED_CONTAM: hypothetical protein FKN15_066136 [Acipenser sinensis]
MLQHPGLGPSEISASAVVPCLSPPVSFGFEEFTNFSPLVKEELRFTILNKCLANGINSTVECMTMNTERPTEHPRVKKEESEKLESINADLKAQIEALKSEKQQLVYMLNLHRPTCIVRAQNGRTPEDERNLFIQQIAEGTLQG